MSAWSVTDSSSINVSSFSALKHVVVMLIYTQWACGSLVGVLVQVSLCKVQCNVHWKSAYLCHWVCLWFPLVQSSISGYDLWQCDAFISSHAFSVFSVTLMLALNALWAALKNCSNNTVCSVHVPLRCIEVSLLSLDSLCHPGRVRYSVFSLTLYISINTLEILFFSRWKMHSNWVFHNSYACTELYSHALHLSGSVWLMWAAVQGIKEVCLTKPP